MNIQIEMEEFAAEEAEKDQQFTHVDELLRTQYGITDPIKRASLMAGMRIYAKAAAGRVVNRLAAQGKLIEKIS